MSYQEPASERLPRILSRAAELLIEHEGWTVRMAYAAAVMEDCFLWGESGKGGPTPRGLVHDTPNQEPSP